MEQVLIALSILLSNGSQSIQSPYHLALLLYEFCQENDIAIRSRDEKFYDKILVKFILYSVMDEHAPLVTPNQISVPTATDQQQQSKTNESAQSNNNANSSHQIQQAVISELVDLLRPNLFPQLTNRITTTLTSTADKLLVTHNLEPPAASSTTSSSSLYESITVTAISTSLPGPRTIMDDSRSSSVVVVSTSDPDEHMSVSLFEFLKSTLLKSTLKAKKLFEIVLKYNPNSQYSLLKALLSAIDKTVNELSATDSSASTTTTSSSAAVTVPAPTNPQPISNVASTSSLASAGSSNPVSRRRSINANNAETVSSQNQTRKTTLYALLGMLGIFKLFQSSERLLTQTSTSSSSNLLGDNKKYESIALIQRCFKNICEKFDMLWSHNLDDLEENYRMVYTCFLQFDNQDSPSAQPPPEPAGAIRPSSPGSVSSLSLSSQAVGINLFDLFTKVHYDIDRHHTVSLTMINNEIGVSNNNYLVYSLVRQFSGAQKKNQLWRRLFMYCYMENKILLRCLIVS